MKCKICEGFGYLQIEGPRGIPQAKQCDCVLDKVLAVQAEKAWKNLSIVPIKKSTELLKYQNKNLLITSDRDSLRIQLRTFFAKVRNPSLFFKVVGDHTLMSAWLGSIHAQGVAVADPDFQRDLKVFSLEDLAESPHILIVRLGTKRARNVAMPEVLVETIEIREHLNKVTWLVEEPSKPLEEGHLSWSPTLQDSLDDWDHIRLDVNKTSKNQKQKGKVTSEIGEHRRIKL